MGGVRLDEDHQNVLLERLLGASRRTSRRGMHREPELPSLLHLLLSLVL
jgi:hypothetical protein